MYRPQPVSKWLCRGSVTKMVLYQKTLVNSTHNFHERCQFVCKQWHFLTFHNFVCRHISHASKHNDSNQSSCQEVFSTGQCLRDYKQPPAATHQLQDPHFSLSTSGCQTVAGRSLCLCDKGHTWQTGFKYTLNNQLFHYGVVHKPLTWDTLKRDND